MVEIGEGEGEVALLFDQAAHLRLEGAAVDKAGQRVGRRLKLRFLERADGADPGAGLGRERRQLRHLLALGGAPPGR